MSADKKSVVNSVKYVSVPANQTDFAWVICDLSFSLSGGTSGMTKLYATLIVRIAVVHPNGGFDADDCWMVAMQGDGAGVWVVDEASPLKEPTTGRTSFNIIGDGFLRVLVDTHASLVTTFLAEVTGVVVAKDYS